MSRASAAGWVWRHEAWNLNDVSVSAQRVPSRSVSRAGSASLDMPAAMPCAPSRMRFAPVKPSRARYAAVSPFDAALAAAGPALRHEMLTTVRRLPDAALEEATLDRLQTCVANVVNQAIGKELVESVGFRKFMYTAM